MTSAIASRDEIDRLQRPPRTRRAGRYVRADGGEWDWFYSLPDPERTYVRAHYMTELGVHPDVLADRMGCSIDEAMSQWIEMIRLTRAVKAHDGRGRSADPLEWEEPEWACLPDFIGVAGIAVIMGVKDPTIRQWRRRGKLPEPTYLVDDMHPIWSREDIGAWLDAISLLAG